MCQALTSIHIFNRSATVCKTVRPMLSDRCLCLSVCLFVCDRKTLVYCGQTVGWIKIPLGMEVGLGPGHIVLDGDQTPPPPKKKQGAQQAPLFCPCLLWPNGRPSQQLLNSCFAKLIMALLIFSCSSRLRFFTTAINVLGFGFTFYTYSCPVMMIN